MPCSNVRLMLPIPLCVLGPKSSSCGYMRAYLILFRTTGIYFFYKLYSWVSLKQHTPRGYAILDIKTEFQQIQTYSSENFLQERTYVRDFDCVGWNMNWSFYPLDIPWIMPRLLYGVYAEIVWTFLVVSYHHYWLWCPCYRMDCLVRPPALHWINICRRLLEEKFQKVEGTSSST